MKQINRDTTKIVQAKEEDVTLGSWEAMKSFKVRINNTIDIMYYIGQLLI